MVALVQKDLRSTDTMINVFMDNLVAAVLGKLAQLDSLRLGILVNGRNSQV
jgi:hypothetical protein